MSVVVIDPRELEALAAAEPVDVVDVRDAAEFDSGHVPGARHVPLDALRGNAAALLPKDNIVFVCARGTRSETAAGIARAAGRLLVRSLDGGTLAWAKAGLPLVVPPPRAGGGEPGDVSTPTATIIEATPELDQIVGANLRELRAARGLSLDDLARASQVARMLLGQIELGRAVPSIGVVWKIAQALGVPFSTLLAAKGGTGTSVLKKSTAKRLLSADGRFSSRALFPFGEPRQVEFYELWLAPHGREDAEPHARGTRENIIVTAGRLELKIGGEVHRLDTGDAILFTADVPHSYANPDAAECWMHLVMTYTERAP